MPSPTWHSLFCCLPSRNQQQQHQHRIADKVAHLPPTKSPRKVAAMEPINIRPDDPDTCILPNRRVKFDSKIEKGLLPASAIKFGEPLWISGLPETIIDEDGKTHRCIGILEANWSPRGVNNQTHEAFYVTDSLFTDDHDVLLPPTKKRRKHSSPSRQDGTILPIFRNNKS